MKFLKVIEILSASTVDYKNLDIEKFIPGTQVYDLENGVCLVQTTEEDFEPHAHIFELTAEEYHTQAEIINAMTPVGQELTEIEKLKAENEALRASQLEQDALIMKLYLGGLE